MRFCMKVLVFAHVPPPHHGLSLMIQTLLQGLAHHPEGVELHHIDARFATGIDDVGRPSLGKGLRLLGYLARAAWLRLRHGIGVFYYVPAPVKPSALVRDWIVLPFAKALFPRVVLHWHSGGLGTWCDATPATWPRTLTRWCLRGADLSITLNAYSRQEAARLAPRATVIVPNGVPDPCPSFETTVLPLRLQRHRERHLNPTQSAISHQQSTISPFRVLYLAHCTREKGLFDALEAVRAFPGPVELTVAGAFLSEAERDAFHVACRSLPAHVGVHTAGFVSGEAKDRLLRESDCLLFPSTFPTEVQPVSVIEALAWGLPCAVYDWRSVGELLEDTGLPCVPPHRIPELTAALEQCAAYADFNRCRRRYLDQHHIDAFLRGMIRAFRRVEAGGA